VKFGGASDHAPELRDREETVLPTGRRMRGRSALSIRGQAEHGAWKDKVILVARDEFSNLNRIAISSSSFRPRSSRDARDRSRRRSISTRSTCHLYPFVGDVKPAARNDLIKGGATAPSSWNTDGHGSPLQMADERVMVTPTSFPHNRDAAPCPFGLLFRRRSRVAVPPGALAQTWWPSTGRRDRDDSAAAPTYPIRTRLPQRLIYKAPLYVEGQTGDAPGSATRFSSRSTRSPPARGTKQQRGNTSSSATRR